MERSSRSIQKLGIHQAVHTSKNFAYQKRSQKATCVGWCKADINEGNSYYFIVNCLKLDDEILYALGPLYQIVFDDRSAPTTISESAFNQARKAYLAETANKQQAKGHVEPPPRRKPQTAKNNTNQKQQPATSNISSDNNNNNSISTSTSGTTSSDNVVPVPSTNTSSS